MPTVSFKLPMIMHFFLHQHHRFKAFLTVHKKLFKYYSYRR